MCRPGGGLSGRGGPVVQPQRRGSKSCQTDGLVIACLLRWWWQAMGLLCICYVPVLRAMTRSTLSNWPSKDSSLAS